MGIPAVLRPTLTIGLSVVHHCGEKSLVSAGLFEVRHFIWDDAMCLGGAGSGGYKRGFFVCFLKEKERNKDRQKDC